MSQITRETAVLVIDMQNDFCSSNGTLAKRGVDVSHTQELSERLPTFIDKARAEGALIVWIRNVSSEEYLSEARRARSESLGWSSLDMAHEGSWGAELYDPFEMKDGDVEVIKR